MLSINNVTKSYARNAPAAVKSLSLTVNASEIYGFIGPNGAGKTTTIKMACGVLRIDSGSIKINGIDISDDPIAAKKMLAYVPDSPYLPQKLKGTEYLNFIGDMYDIPRSDRADIIHKHAKSFDIDDALSSRIGSYSHGMQQKLALTGALLTRPKLMVLDEPMVGLDPKSAHALKETLKEMCEDGASVFFSTHVLEVAEKFCSRVGIIQHGALIAQGTLDELRGGKDETLEEIFLELTDA
ncbi:MAG: ABC transporter ATP-binding protein [Eubacteriaceae bacterium]|nr:ABC transporter ATP-binding protein [Eubacteriaceae bacterium]